MSMPFLLFVTFKVYAPAYYLITVSLSQFQVSAKSGISHYCLCSDAQESVKIHHPTLKYMKIYTKLGKRKLVLSAIDYSSSNVVSVPRHYENTPMQYTAIFHGCKMIFFLFLLKTLIVGTR